MWHIMGAVNLDMLTDVGARSFDLMENAQDWLDIGLDTGGFAGNLARFAHEADTLDFRVLAVTGDDDAGQLVRKRLAEAIPGAEIRNVVVDDAPTGLVMLIFRKGGPDEQSARTVFGPKFSAIDMVRYADIREHLSRTDGRPVRLILDGYTLRLDPASWISDIEAMWTEGVETYLELLPHDIWRIISVGDLARLVHHSALVSASLSTLTRIVAPNADPVGGNDLVGDANRICELLRSAGLPGNGSLIARYGERNAEYSLRMVGDAPPVLWRYGADEYNRTKGNQDRLFLHEITGMADRLTRERIELS